MDVNQMVGALVYLEKRLGHTPTVEDLADQAGCSVPTARIYLQRAVGEGKITQRGGKYMSLTIAGAFDKLKEAGSNHELCNP